jgi:hypothetical protein
MEDWAKRSKWSRQADGLGDEYLAFRDFSTE